MKTNFKKSIFLLIFITACIRLIVAASLELGNDEVYYWTYSQYLQWNYFDHPPMVALWIRIFTGNLWLQDKELFVRLGSIVSCAAATWFIYKTAEKLHSPKAGWLAACLYNASIYASIIAGIFIMPDSPQMLFWTASLYLLVQLIGNSKSWLYWLLFGACTGLCIMSKVHGAFIWIGFLGFIVFQKRAFLKLPQLYVSLLLTALIISPIIIWNISHQFITYQYHSNRVLVNAFAFKPIGFFREFFGEILYNNPIIVVLSALATIAFFKRYKDVPPALKVFFWIALPMIATLLGVALFKDTLPHWSGPAYVTLMPVTAIYATTFKFRPALPRAVKWAFGVITFAVVLGLVVINFYPGTLGKKESTNLGKNDFTLDMNGWKNAGKSFAAFYRNDVQKGNIAAGAAVVCYKWFPAAHEDYYFCRPLGLPMVGLGALNDLHEYAVTNRWDNTKINLNDVYCIVPSNENYNIKEKYAAYYTNVAPVAQINSYRGKVCARHFYIYRLSGRKNLTAMQ